MASELAGVVLLHPLQALVRAEESVFRHVSRIFARGRMLAHSFREGANVVRPGAAAHAKVTNPERERFAPELGDFEAVARERIQCRRKWPVAPIAVPVGIAQRLK